MDEGRLGRIGREKSCAVCRQGVQPMRLTICMQPEMVGVEQGMEAVAGQQETARLVAAAALARLRPGAAFALNRRNPTWKSFAAMSAR